MSDDEFEARLTEWLDMPGEGEPYPYCANPYPADPRDARFDALCALYLEADENQRAQIPAILAPEESTRAYARIADWIAARERARNDLSNLIFYMRRLSSSIRSEDDTSRLRLGLAAAAILQEREDYRDIIRPRRTGERHVARGAGLRPLIRRAGQRHAKWGSGAGSASLRAKLGHITVGEGAVLGELAELADELHATYPWESKADIVHFVLTGAVPAVPPLWMYYSRKSKLDLEESPGGFRQGKITLEVAPWISVKTIEAAYRDAKRQVYGNRKYRRLEEKSLKMIRSIAGYDEPLEGRRLLEAWNATEWVEENPSWYYDPDRRGESSRFWRDYHRARRALVYEKRLRPDNG